MRVSRLEIFGFKSFMDRLVLPLDGGVTGIVGPNGCGKSNIVDALRWVLGETKAKNLRGGHLEDVIFNGTDKLRPLGLAEVTLSLRASGDNFFSDLVSPDLEAEMLVQEVAAEAEEGALENEEEGGSQESESEGEDNSKPHLTVIDGRKNKVESEGSQDNEDLLGDVEEAKADLQASGEEQSAQQENEEGVSPQVSATLLSRFSWLRSASEVQVTRRLYRSGESEFFINRVPCRLKDLKEFFRAVGVSARAYTIVAQGEVARIVTSKPVERRLILEEAAGVLGFRDKIRSAERRLKETEINISRIEDIHKEVTRQVNSLRRQASKAKNRERLKEEIREHELTLFREDLRRFRESSQSVKGALAEAKEEESSIETKLAEVQTLEESARSELMSVDVEGDDLRSRVDGLKEEINNRARQRTERSARISELRAFQASRETELKRLAERRATIDERCAESASQIESLEKREEEIAVSIQELDLEQGQEHLAELSRKLDELRQLYREKDSELRKLRETLSRNHGELEAIEKQLVAASPISRLKESMGREVGRMLEQVSPDAKLLVEGLRIPSEHVTAVQAVVAEKAGFLVADNPFQLARVFEQEVLSKSTNSDIPGLGVLQAGSSVDVDMDEARRVPFTSLLEVLDVEERCQQAACTLLRHVYLAPTLSEAISYFENGSHVSGATLVTPEGDLVTEHSFLSLRHKGGVLQLKSRIDELQQIVAGLEEDQAGRVFERDELQKSIDSIEEEHARVLRDIQEKQRQERELTQEQGKVRGHLQAERRVAEQAKQDIERIGRQEGETKLRLEEYITEQRQVEEELAALVPEEEAKLHAQLRELNETYLKLDERRRERREQLGKVAQEVEGIRRALDKQRSKLSELQLSGQKAELEEAHLRERVERDYGEGGLHHVFETELTQEPLSDEDRRERGAAVVRLKTRIQREGEVDPTSIERFEEESVRLEELDKQKKDLSSAATTLRKTIERLRETSIERFLAIFNQVKENFTKLVPRLFGGGKGTLELEDPSNPLDSGVMIVARPPGKKLKSIDLLSGGEKALCATALIFSMFMVRPSPLCVLDEVDAPLDEANLVRFLSLIKEMSAKTQFLLITHNKGSMSASDRMVGVTMEQPGASKVITVSLQEAYDAVA